ncbi:MAG TPA: hypothetical protein V6C97_05985 [Oculatellaceae cyanobacterium]
MKHHIHVKTCKKPEILRGFLTSFEKFGYAESENILTVGDDNPGECLEIFKQFPWIDAYLTGNTNAIWANNNRGIKYFLEHTDADALMLVDHDVELLNVALFAEIERAHIYEKQHHITGFAKGLDGIDGLQVVFPCVAESQFLRWHPGCHGVMLWQTRALIEQVGYQLAFDYFYGAEHAEYSHRCLVAQGQSMKLYPVLKRSGDFFHLNPNDFSAYPVDFERVTETNQQKMLDRDADTVRGRNLRQGEHNLDKEIIVKSRDGQTAESIRNSLL